MVVVSGMERMTFEVLRTLKEHGAEVHCILNDWENHRIRELAESIGATWSTGYYRYTLRRTRNPWRILQAAWSTLRTSAGLLSDARRFAPTHILVPEFGGVLRNAPTLLLLRARGIPGILRLPNAPSPGRFYALLWRFAIAPLVTRVVANSRFTLERCRELRIPETKLLHIPNRVSDRALASSEDHDVVEIAKRTKTLLCVGQIAPFKGTEIAVEAALHLRDRGSDVQLVVVGAEPEWPPDRVDYYQALRKRVDESRHRDWIHFVGARKNVLEIMFVSYLLLVPIPDEESFGNVVLEAKSVGLPVVAFPSGGIPELVEHQKTGFLCNRMDRDGLVEGIRFFLDSAERREDAAKESLRFFADPACPYSAEAFSRSWCRAFNVDREMS